MQDRVRSCCCRCVGLGCVHHATHTLHRCRCAGNALDAVSPSLTSLCVHACPPHRAPAAPPACARHPLLPSHLLAPAALQPQNHAARRPICAVQPPSHGCAAARQCLRASLQAHLVVLALHAGLVCAVGAPSGECDWAGGGGKRAAGLAPSKPSALFPACPLLQVTRSAMASPPPISSCKRPLCGSQPPSPAAAWCLKTRPAACRRPKQRACELGRTLAGRGGVSSRYCSD